MQILDILGKDPESKYFKYHMALATSYWFGINTFQS